MTGPRSIEDLRLLAVSQTLFEPTTLKDAIELLGFVQADPIRAPARAQYLILRHRVEGYRAGDLDREYEALDVEEDYLYVYGFVPQSTWRLLHPPDTRELTPLEVELLAAVRNLGPTHPKQLEEMFGKERATNAWGSFSRATTMALEDLHYRGLLRVARRQSGVRIYEAVTTPSEPVAPEEALHGLAMIVARLLAPAPHRSLQQAIALVHRYALHLSGRDSTVRDLLRAGVLEGETVDGVPYVWPAGADAQGEPEPRVRILCPFDPVVWDRRRFEHLWGWPYRFEAYTPPAKRLRGYYAMPLLWRDDVIGWANLKVAGGKLDVDVGFVAGAPSGAAFKAALDEEVGRFEAFLGLTTRPEE